MHREIQGQIEIILACQPPIGERPAGAFSLDDTARSVSEHLEKCAECRQEVSAMQQHSELLRALRAPEQVPEPRPGFYARVMERIEAEGPVSIWNLFMESAFGRRIAVASVALALVLGVYLVSSERDQEPMVAEQGVAVETQQGVVNVLAGTQSSNGVTNSAIPASATEFGLGSGAAPDDITAQILLEQQMLMQQMIAQMNNAASEDQVLVNLATYREQ